MRRPPSIEAPSEARSKSITVTSTNPSLLQELLYHNPSGTYDPTTRNINNTRDPSSQGRSSDLDQHGPVYGQLIRHHPSLMSKVPSRRKNPRKHTLSQSEATPSSVGPSVCRSFVAGKYTSFDGTKQELLIRKCSTSTDADHADHGPFRAKTDLWCTPLALYESRRDREHEQHQYIDERPSASTTSSVPLLTAVDKCVRFLRRIRATVDGTTLTAFTNIMAAHVSDSDVRACESKLQQLLSHTYPHLLLLMADYTRASLLDQHEDA